MNNRTYTESRRTYRGGLLSALVFALAALINSQGALGGSPAVNDYRKELDRILTGHRDPKAKLGARVVNLSTGQVLYEHDAEQPLIPASNMKLVVIAAALDRFGKDYQYKTMLAIRERDLVVVGCGDPTFGDEKLFQARGDSITAVFHIWAEKLAAAGVRQVSGNIVIDDSIFDDRFVHPNWPADQFQAWYEAPIGGLNFNANCVSVQVKPGKSGAAAIATLMPGTSLLKLENRLKSGRKHAPGLTRRRDSDTLVVAGSITRADTLGPVTIRDPGMYFGYVFKTVLAAKGIRVQGKVVREKLALGPDRVPAGGHGVAFHQAPLYDAARRAGQDSLGMMAEGLIKLLGSQESGVGSWETGRAALKRFLLEAGVPEGQFVIDDGSGLSRKNRLSARAATQVLAYMYKAPGGRFDQLRSSLARPGRDGTLRKRLRGPETRDRVFAKTGYINGVRTLAGYVQTKSGQWLAFAFFYNGTGKTRPLAQIQDQACELLVNWPIESTAQTR